MTRLEKPTIRVATTSDLFTGRIDHDAVIAYAMATNDPNDVHSRGEVAPPLFTTSLLLDAHESGLHAGMDVGAVTGHRANVHAEHDVSFFGPVTPGMNVQWRAAIWSVRPTPAGPLVTLRLQVTDSDERPLVEHLWSTMFVGGDLDLELGPSLPDHTFPEAARSTPIASHTLQIDRDQGFRYSGASGDRPPHALDDEDARGEGFPGKIVQGMCTFAMCSGAAIAELTAGDPAHLRRLAGRFSAPVHPGNELTVEFYEAGATADGARCVAFEAISGGKTVVKHGRAEIADN